MKTLLLALTLLSVAPLAYAQPGFPPGPPGPPGAPPGPPGPPPPGFHGDDWRHPRDDHAEWRRREEFHEEQYRRMEWRRAHCVRDYGGHEYCR